MENKNNSTGHTLQRIYRIVLWVFLALGTFDTTKVLISGGNMYSKIAQAQNCDSQPWRQQRQKDKKVQKQIWRLPHPNHKTIAYICLMVRTVHIRYNTKIQYIYNTYTIQ